MDNLTEKEIEYIRTSIHDRILYIERMLILNGDLYGTFFDKELSMLKRIEIKLNKKVEAIDF